MCAPFVEVTAARNEINITAVGVSARSALANSA
jgi:hypothetical protein